MPRLEKILNPTFGDPAFRYGLKFGIAGVAAVFLALLIRLQEPVWALFTVFVLMIAQYLGAIGEKSVFRVIGTVIGGLIGYLLTGSLQQSPFIYLPLIGIVVGVSTAMFGQSRYPYAFLLCGLTTVVVSANGLANPENSWQYMVWRTEEVVLGILVTMVVQSVFWPRFARVEFLDNLRQGFGDLRECFSAAIAAASPEDAESASSRAEKFPERITGLRQLLDFGARESQHFRNRLSTFFELTNCQSRIASAMATLREPLPPDSIYRQRLSEEIRGFSTAISDALGDLEKFGSSPESRRVHRDNIDRAVSRLEARLLEMRHEKAFGTIPLKDSMIFSTHVLAYQDIRRHVSRALDLLDSLQRDPLQPSREHEPFLSPWPPPFWIRTGIKSGIAIVIALIIQDWLNPPGATMFTLGTWVFTAMNATSPGLGGDRRAFHYAIVSIFSLLLLSLVLLAARPLLSSYAVMNSVIFTWLFVWGYLCFRIRGMTIPMQVSMLCIVGILGLNGQEAISFQQIVDFFFGIALATVLAAVIQRLLWPSLPQWEIRDRLIELADISRQILRDGPEAVPLWQRTRLALIPGEITSRIKYIAPPIYPVSESIQLGELLSHLFKVGYHLSVTSRRLDPILTTQNAKAELEALRAVESQIDAVLTSVSTALQSNRAPAFDRPAFDKTVADFKSSIADLRLRMISAAVAPLQTLEMLGFAERYCLAADDAASTQEFIHSRNIQLLNNDCAL